MGSNEYVNTDDFAYKIDLGAGKEYYMPVFETLTDFSLDISDITTIDRIRITAMNADTDYLVVSYCVIAADELPLDIFIGIKERVDAYIASNCLTKYLAGTIQKCSAGQTYVQFVADPIWIDRYSRIYISDGVNSEYHHIERKDGRTIYFSCLDSGRDLDNDHAEGTSVYLSIACQYGMYETEIALPSITIWGLTPELMPKETDVQEDLDTWKTNGSVNSFWTGKWFKYAILIDCESRGVELLAECSRIVRTIIGRERIWINGKTGDFLTTGMPTLIDPTEVVANIPKIQYTCEVEVKEDIFDKVRLPNTTTINNTYDITAGGTL